MFLFGKLNLEKYILQVTMHLYTIFFSYAFFIRIVCSRTFEMGEHNSYFFSQETILMLHSYTKYNTSIYNEKVSVEVIMLP